MKKLFTFCVCIVMATLTLWSQDIIVTNDSQKIEAKILEVSKTEIRYKEYNFLDGPTFVLETKELNSIIYSNGKVVLYNQQAASESQTAKAEVKTTSPSPAPPSNVVTIAEEQTTEADVKNTTPSYPPTSNVAEANEYNVEIYLLSGQIIKAKLMELADKYVGYTFNAKYFTMPASYVEKVKDLRNGKVTTYNGAEHNAQKSTTPIYNPVKYITRKGNSYYYDGSKMRGKDYEYFLSGKCTEAYNQYKSGHNIAIAGWVLFGIGVGLDVGFSWWAPYTWVPGLACEIACIPTLAIGYVKMHNSADTYNDSCAKRSTSYWSINASQNGIGIAYNF